MRGFELLQMTSSPVIDQRCARARLLGLPLESVRALVAAAVLALSLPVSPPVAAADTPPLLGSGLPVPRFVSLKSGWVYRRAGLPLEVIKEFETWRQVRDAEGATGWILQSFLSGRRTGLVLPWERKAGAQPPLVPIMADDSVHANVVANVEAGVIADLHACDGRWCHVTVDQFSGYIEQKKLWGVYEGETFK